MNQNKSVFDSISFYIFQALVFLTPVFFVPSVSAPFTTVKTGLIIVGSLLLLISFLVGRIKEGSFSFPRSWAYGSVLVFLATYALAAFFSGNIALSIFGQGLDSGSLVFIIALVLLFLCAPLILDTEEKVFYSYTVLFVSFFIVALFEAVHLIFPTVTLAIFTAPTANMIGTWNDLGVFFGLAAILSLLTLEGLSLSKLFRIFVYICFVASLAFLVIINFSQVWIVLGFFGLGVLIHGLSFKKKSSPRRFPVRGAIVLGISLVFTFFGTPLGNFISTATSTSQVSVRPSWSATFDIIEASLPSHALLGVGPDRFVSAWLLHKPAGINSTIFWNIDFDYGVGFIPSMLVTIGLIGSLGALVFLILFLVQSIRIIFTSSRNSVGTYLLTSTFLAAAYLWVFAIVYVPSATLLALTFVFSGLFIAVAVAQEVIPLRTFTFLDNPVKNFISILVAVLLIVGAIALGYAVTVHIIAETYFEHGTVILSTSGDLQKGEASLTEAFNMNPDPRYSRTIADAYLASISDLLQSTTTTQSQAVTQFQGYLGTAIQAAQQSVSLDPTDYQNDLELAKVYGSVVSLKINGAYDAAKAAYTQALALNPSDPEIYFDMASLDVSNNDDTTAEADAGKALSEKNDYADAIYLLSQIYISENKLSQATDAVKALAVLSPSNAGVFFELGLLEYNQKDYSDAVSALSQAITLSPGYANAEYFLGLSDYYLGDTTDAITEFKSLEKSNPDNADIVSILANLRAGRAPLSSAAANSSTLPVSQ